MVECFGGVTFVVTDAEGSDKILRISALDSVSSVLPDWCCFDDVMVLTNTVELSSGTIDIVKLDAVVSVLFDDGVVKFCDTILSSDAVLGARPYDDVFFGVIGVTGFNSDDFLRPIMIVHLPKSDI